MVSRGRYDELSKGKDAKMKEIKDSGLGVMKAGPCF